MKLNGQTFNWACETKVEHIKTEKRSAIDKRLKLGDSQTFNGAHLFPSKLLDLLNNLDHWVISGQIVIMD